MKIFFQDGKVTAESENLEDIEILISLKNTKVTKTAAKKHYKNQRRRQCPTCGKTVKGKLGLSLHKNHAHPELVIKKPKPYTSLQSAAKLIND